MVNCGAVRYGTFHFCFGFINRVPFLPIAQSILLLQTQPLAFSSSSPLPPLPFPSSPLHKVFRFPEFPTPFSLLPSLFLNCPWFYLLLLILLIILSEDWIYFAMWYPCNDLATWFISDERPSFVRLLIELTMDYQPIFFVVWFWLF